MKCYTMLCDFLCLTYGTTNGIIYVADVGKSTFGHVSQMNPLGLRKILYYIQETMPTYIKGIHLINAPAAMKNLMNIIKPFMKKKLIDMVNIIIKLIKFNYLAVIKNYRFREMYNILFVTGAE